MAWWFDLCREDYSFQYSTISNILSQKYEFKVYHCDEYLGEHIGKSNTKKHPKLKNYDEKGRLHRDNAHKVEFLTTVHYFDRLFKEKSIILDACAGTGAYSLYLANKGHKVTACDLVKHNVEIIKESHESEKLNAAAADDFDKWMKYHIATCEEPSILGSSLHGLDICKKHSETR